ncbi:MAG: METTL5 family protein [Candidatus Aenigmarchaeota archaeon]|nr:METTL5 family protein [Candidatus Aenigmarchaeota archaeon]
MNKKQLEIILSQLKELSLPKPSLEQYAITSSLAAEVLNLAYLHGDIKDKVVFDFGCGSGRLGIGAVMLGAKFVVGIDIDKSAIRTAKENLESYEARISKKLPVYFVVCDIGNWFSKAETVVQNPPFGIQTRHADRLFLESALRCGKRIYSLHKNGYKKTREFIKKFIEDRKGKIEKTLKYKFSIPHMFKFHKKPKATYNVDLYIIER